LQLVENILELFPLIWLGLVAVALVALAIWRPGRHMAWLILIVLMVAFAVWVVLPTNPGIHWDTNRDGTDEINFEIAVRQGLDLRGGLQVLLEADLPEGAAPASGSMDEARRIIDQRIDSLGALEPVVQLQGERRIIVELPGYEDPEMAVSLIRDTALLEFVDFGPAPLAGGTPIVTDYSQQQAETLGISVLTGEESVSEMGEPIYHTVMTGEILQTADVAFDPQSGAPVVQFSLTPEGAVQFGDYTTAHEGEYLGIVLDGEVVSSPVIRTAITGGSGVIEGNFDLDSANLLARQLRYGALPVPLRVDSISSVGPTLGAISIEQSVRAGIIGVIAVLVFMLVYYRLPGVAADLALVAFALLNFALFKLIPVTLTLPAITGFLISVGTAVDGNVLIFERMKEEVRAGKQVSKAIEAGFDRAWTSIRDSNLSTIIICVVLYAFGTRFGAGAVRGFAMTLALGLVVNLFTAVTVTRTFLHHILKLVPQRGATTRWLLGVSAEEAANV
jgi:protein-export membrane protein SecD